MKIKIYEIQSGQKKLIDDDAICAFIKCLSNIVIGQSNSLKKSKFRLFRRFIGCMHERNKQLLKDKMIELRWDNIVNEDNAKRIGKMILKIDS